jgi:hypothetical protein
MFDLNVCAMLAARGIRCRKLGTNSFHVFAGHGDKFGRFTEHSRESAWKRMLWCLNVK